MAKHPWTIQKLCLKIAILAMPFLALSLSYFVYDPFQAVHPKAPFYNCNIEPNRDFASTETYLRNSKETPFDSFVFGSSRSMALKCSEWEQYLDPNNKCFHYDAANETLFGILGKVKLLDRHNAPMDHVFILLDSEILTREDNPKQHLFMKHPEVSGDSYFNFQLVTFRAYFQDFFFIKYLDYKWFSKYRKYMKGTIWDRAILFDPHNNDKNYRNTEADDDPQKHYEAHRSIFYSRRDTDKHSQKKVIGSKQLVMLQQIADILKKHKTQVTVVIAPLYDQVYFNSEDLGVLKGLFGEERVYDYSGVNDITEQVLNYIETSHFRKEVGARILKEMFGQSARLS